MRKEIDDLVTAVQIAFDEIIHVNLAPKLHNTDGNHATSAEVRPRKPFSNTDCQEKDAFTQR